MTRRINPWLLQCAAHGLGHTVWSQAHGIHVVRVDIDLRGSGRGNTHRVLPYTAETATFAQLQTDTIGDIAGFEAESMWCRQHGGRADRNGSRTDFTEFEKYRRRARLTERSARSRANRVLCRHWGEIERLAPVLATRGSIHF